MEQATQTHTGNGNPHPGAQDPRPPPPCAPFVSSCSPSCNSIFNNSETHRTLTSIRPRKALHANRNLHFLGHGFFSP